MAYATSEDFVNVTGQEAPADIENLIDDASDTIDRVTYNRIRGVGYDNLTEYQQKMVRKAVCYQAAFLTSYGAYLSVPIGSYSAGSVSLSFNRDDNMLNGELLDPKAINAIKNSGLATRRL